MWGMIAMGAMKVGGSLINAASVSSSAEANADAMRREAEYLKYKSIVDEKAYLEQAHKVLAEANVAYAKSGVRSTSGSVQDVFADNYQTMLEDVSMIRLQGKFNVNKAEMSADMYDKQKKTAVISGLLGAGASGMSTYNKIQEG
jgi:hypothetical protein